MPTSVRVEMRCPGAPLPALLAVVPAATAVTNIWLAGDSTMAEGGGGTGTQGWGHYLQYSFDTSEYVVNNEAVAGRSARSYWAEGRFQAIADDISAGDVSLPLLTSRLLSLARGARRRVPS